MLKLSKKTEYAIIAIIAISEQNNGQLLTAKDIAQRYSIPGEILGKVMQSLAKNGIIISQQGVRGGYRLDQNLDRISISQIIQAIEGPINIVQCTNHDHSDCTQADSCNIRGPMEIIQMELINFFNGITLKSFMDNYSPYITRISMRKQNVL